MTGSRSPCRCAVSGTYTSRTASGPSPYRSSRNDAIPVGACRPSSACVRARARANCRRMRNAIGRGLTRRLARTQATNAGKTTFRQPVIGGTAVGTTVVASLAAASTSSPPVLVRRINTVRASGSAPDWSRGSPNRTEVEEQRHPVPLVAGIRLADLPQRFDREPGVLQRTRVRLDRPVLALEAHRQPVALDVVGVAAFGEVRAVYDEAPVTLDLA